MNDAKLPQRTLDYIRNGADEGNRSAELLQAAIQFRDAGLPQSQAESDLIGRATLDGLSMREAQTVIKSAFSRPQRDPIGKGNGASKPLPPRPAKPAAPPVDWPACLDAFTPAHADKLAKLRGISAEFFNWLHSQGELGICDGKPAFANRDASGKVVSAHVRVSDDFWNFKPSGHPVAPLIFGDIATAGFVIAAESQWDALAVMDKLGWHNSGGLPDTAVIVTRGSGNAKLIHGRVSPDAVVYALTQNDAPGQKWLADLAANAVRHVLNVATPAPLKDCNDWTRAGATRADIEAAMHAAKIVTPEAAQPEAASESSGPGRLTLRSPDEILAMQFDDSDIYLAERLLADGQPLVIAAQGGAGKSRLALQLAAAIVSGRDFIGFTTGKPNSRWLFLQTENSNRRLKFDLDNLRRWLGDDWEKFNAQVVIHTLENDTDGFVNLDSLENQGAIEHAIKASKPDGIIVDPLNEFSVGDLNKDADMRATLQTISRICKKGNHLRAIVVLHHALTGRGGAAKATGYDRASFARNSKALHAWTRGQINIAPIDPDSNDRLAIACGKCSNGKEFETFAVKLNPDTFIYERDNSVDLSEWQTEMTGTKPKRNASPELVRELATGNPTKGALVKSVMQEVGCGKSAAYDAIDRAVSRKRIHYSKATKTYAQGT